MSKDEKRHKILLLIFIFFLQHHVCSSNSCPNKEKLFSNAAYKEDFTLDGETFYSKKLESDGSFNNFSSNDSNSREDYPNEYPNDLYRGSRSKNRTFISRREIKNNLTIVSNFYRNIFDLRYSLGSNYSDIFKKADKGERTKYLKALKFSNYTYESFPSLYEIYDYLESLEKFGKRTASVFPLKYQNGSWNIVHTNFGNEILTIRISSDTGLGANKENRIIVIVAGIHGRDWYAVQSAVYLATELITNKNRTSEQDFDWWIIPVFNPDGYEITRKNSNWRNWEKNLQGTRDIDSDECFGIDLDLNFEYQWLGCDDSWCDSNYPGKVPFSSPEAQGLRDTLEAFSDNLDCFVALKEGKQALVYPFSDTFQSPRGVDDFKKISMRALKAFSKHIEGFYEYGQSSFLINTSAGFIEDWAKIHLGVDKSFAFYLGPTVKDRRDLKSQHLMDHMNGVFELLNVIVHGKIRKGFTNSSSMNYLSLYCIVIHFFLV